MVLQLFLFLIIAVLLALTPVFVGVRALKIGNPSWFAALAAVAALLALQDLAQLFLDEPRWIWLAGLIGGGFAFSLLLDCPYWKAFLICILVLLMQWFATVNLLEGTPPVQELQRLVKGSQAEIWPQYQD
ncbi:hypothetical protein [Ferrimonas pelagia]|uniref:Uncharacterized protein n=1 Tax=Ferrimonas pelagia TaxID=1177826 RepID=A0ABP9FG92_9GAMM